MALHSKLAAAARTLSAAALRRTPMVAAGVLAVGTMAGLVLPAAAASAASGPSLSYGTLDTQPSTAAAEAQAGVGNAMLELNWSSFEPSPGVVSASYLATMRYYLGSFQAAGQRVTLGLGLQNPPAWVYDLPDSTYVDEHGNVSAEANFVFSQAVRTAAARYLALVARSLPFSAFWAVRLTSGGDGEMLYPGGGTYWAFDSAALTGRGLAAGMTPNPDPSWIPGTPGLTQPQVRAWVAWYVHGLGSVTGWQMRTLSLLGFAGYFQTVTPGSGTRPDGLARLEAQNLPDDATTGVGAVWSLYYRALASPRIMAYISSVADQSGGNDTCQSADTATPVGSAAADSWSATRWITRLARQSGLAVGGENPGYDLPASLDSFYTDPTGTGMMAAALSQARTCGFTAFYWAHDIHLWDGTVPFTRYANAISS